MTYLQRKHHFSCNFLWWQCPDFFLEKPYPGTRGSLWCIHLRHKKKPICSTCHIFCFLFRLRIRIWLFMSISMCVSRKREGGNRTGAPGPFSQCLVEPALLIYFCCFVRITLVILCSLLNVLLFYYCLCPWIPFFWLWLESWLPLLLLDNFDN